MTQFELFLTTSCFLLFFFLVLGSIEYGLLVQRRSRVPLRIHVNGIRGKSSTVRLIAGVLREAGYQVIAKATGTMPRIVYPTGEEKDIIRIEKPNILEQLLVFREAEKEKANAVVVECMAILPQLQKFCEEKIICSHIGVITNVRPDHLDVMGPTMDDVAEALSHTVPKKGILVTAEKERLSWLENNAREKNSQTIAVRSEDVTDAMMKPFRYIEHKDNVAVALGISRHLGIDDDVAFKGMYGAQPDPGVLRVIPFREGERCYEFVNAFAANDGASTHHIWQMLESNFTPDQKKFLILYARSDRAQRSVDIIPFLMSLPIDYFILVGDGTLVARTALIKKGIPTARIYDLKEKSTSVIFRKISELSSEKNLLFGAGNIVGIGMDLVNYFDEKAKLK